MDEFKLDHIQRARADALLRDMAFSYEATEAAVFELIWRRDKEAAALSQPAAQGDSCRVDQFSSRICEKGTKSCTAVHSAGGECGGVQKELRWALFALDLVGNKLRAMGSIPNDTQMINLAAAEKSIEAAMLAAAPKATP